jgi:putative ABC transport system ATP-binding protein
MIKLSSINKKYVTGQTEISVLKNINLQIEKGEFVGITGPSGSGKSTLLNLIGFIDQSFEGSYQFNHKRIEKYTDNELSRIRNESVGFIFQNFRLIENKSVLENIELPLIYGGESRRKTQAKVEMILDKVGLKDKIEMKPKELSGGQQQRVAIARAMINQPDFIIADEPTGALDSQTSIEIMNIFKTLNNEGVTIILVTHELEMVRYCSRLIQFLDGEIIDEVMLNETD